MKSVNHISSTYIKRSLFLLMLLSIGLSCSNDDSDSTVVVDLQDNDGDGVSNTIEQNAGTDPNDSCSFNLSQQNLTPSNNWLQLDCDNDCKTNGEELAVGTDPLNGSDFEGSGTYIKEVIEGDLDGSIFYRYFFNQNGTKITEIKNGNDVTTHSYVYENDQIKEIHTFNEDGFAITDVVYTYSNDELNYFTVASYGNVYEYNVEHNGTLVTAHNSSEPPGLFWKQIEYDASMENIIKAEWYRNSNADYIYRVTDYTYDGMGNRISYSSEEMGYDPDTGTYYPLGGQYPITGETYEYAETAVNPMFDAYKPLELTAFLSQYGLFSPMPSPTSPNLCSNTVLDLGYDQFERQYALDCAQPDGKPIQVTQINYNDTRFLRRFIYE